MYVKFLNTLFITVCVHSREVPVYVQKEYRFCQFSKEGTDMDIHSVERSLQQKERIKKKMKYWFSCIF